MWGVFCQHLADGRSDDAIERATLQLNEDLRALGSSLAASTPLPQLSGEQLKPRNTAQSLEFATGPQKAYADTHIPLLNTEKAMAFHSIMSDVDSGDQGAHFIEGPGGSGGPFLYNFSRPYAEEGFKLSPGRRPKSLRFRWKGAELHPRSASFQFE